MAPTNFWMKRQLPELPGVSILFPSVETPRVTIVESPSASAATPTPSSSSQAVATPTPSSSSSLTPTRPTQSSLDQIEESEVESTPSATPTLPTSEGILVQSAPTPSLSREEPVPQSTTTVVRNATVSGQEPATSSGAAQVGAAKGGNAFLDNKVLSGVVFAICGVVGLLLIVLIVWLATRKARENKKMEHEIISWDPDHVRGFSNVSGSQAGPNPDTRSIDELEEKGRSLDSHFNTYTLPSQSVHTKPQQAGGYSDHYAGQRPIQVSLPHGEAQPYRANW